MEVGERQVQTSGSKIGYKIVLGGGAKMAEE